jgi:DNA polymerase-3 subunit delta'
VEANTHPDVFSVSTPEGKHELPVDVMRVFCERMSIKPSRGGRKVGIVLDADEFNEESANSFLKTLEEPPPGSLLLLLATSLERQLPTILSRCQVVHFAPLTPDDMRAVLKEQGVEESKLDRLIAVGGGSVSQALALNDEAFDEVRRQLVEGITSPRPSFKGLAETWNRFNEEAGKETAAQRVRATLVLRLLIETIRQAMRLSVGAETPGLERGEAERLRAFAEQLGPDRLVELIDRCLEAEVHVKRYVQLVLVVESVLEPLTRQIG